MNNAAAKPPPLVSATKALASGQRLEANGDFTGALVFYSEALATLRSVPSDPDEVRCLHGVAWMNLGNALQKLSDRPNLDAAVSAYDAAITLLRSLPIELMPPFRNHLGAAWLNRGHVLLTGADNAGAIASFEQAIAHLAQLPRAALEENGSYRLNLAGAHANLAHSLLGSAPVRACESARSALVLLAPVERTSPVFAAMSLRARRALVTAIGERLVGTTDITALAAEASDAIDDGLAVARHTDPHDPTLRPLALRLFRMGAQFYRIHQPHFLAEFLRENLTTEAFGADSEFRAVAIESLTLALAELQRPLFLIAGQPDAEKILSTAQSLRAMQQELSLPPA